MRVLWSKACPCVQYTRLVVWVDCSVHDLAIVPNTVVTSMSGPPRSLCCLKHYIMANEDLRYMVAKQFDTVLAGSIRNHMWKWDLHGKESTIEVWPVAVSNHPLYSFSLYCRKGNFLFRIFSLFFQMGTFIWNLFSFCGSPINGHRRFRLLQETLL